MTAVFWPAIAICVFAFCFKLFGRSTTERTFLVTDLTLMIGMLLDWGGGWGFWWVVSWLLDLWLFALHALALFVFSRNHHWFYLRKFAYIMLCILPTTLPCPVPGCILVWNHHRPYLCKSVYIMLCILHCALPCTCLGCILSLLVFGRLVFNNV